MITERTRRALRFFGEGHNCAQAVMMAYGDLAGLDEQQSALVSAGFGGGMGRLRDNCGAFSAAVMLLGAMEGEAGALPEKRVDVYRRVQAVHRAFVQRWGTVNCAELLGKPRGAEEPRPEARTRGYYAGRPCAKIILSACRIIEDQLAQSELAQKTAGKQE